MTIKINDKEYEVQEGATVADVAAAYAIGPKGVAVAVNGSVVAPAQWESVSLANGDSLVVIKAFYGG
ncbi:MAG: sulfur carrier protein ThiS [Muribaculaceae bacterium]|nr:sulfur carrier protein ThiS [Muribaculaceae bacterium]